MSTSQNKCFNAEIFFYHFWVWVLVRFFLLFQIYVLDFNGFSKIFSSISDICAGFQQYLSHVSHGVGSYDNQ